MKKALNMLIIGAIVCSGLYALIILPGDNASALLVWEYQTAGSTVGGNDISIVMDSNNMPNIFKMERSHMVKPNRRIRCKG